MATTQPKGTWWIMLTPRDDTKVKIDKALVQQWFSSIDGFNIYNLAENRLNGKWLIDGGPYERCLATLGALHNDFEILCQKKFRFVYIAYSEGKDSDRDIVVGDFWKRRRRLTLNRDGVLLSAVLNNDATTGPLMPIKVQRKWLPRQ